ncbi:hypothetical protein Trydic_g15137 [Trypoxylus dichotomus]
MKRLDNVEAVFINTENIQSSAFLLPKTPINSDIYCKTLGKLHQPARQKRRRRLRKRFRLMHDNARPHISNQTKALLQKLHSPDLVPFHLFRPLKAHLSVKGFKTTMNIKMK